MMSAQELLNSLAAALQMLPVSFPVHQQIASLLKQAQDAIDKSNKEPTSDDGSNNNEPN